MKKTFTYTIPTIILCSFAIALAAQKKIDGYVLSAHDSLPIAAATVTIRETKYIIATKANGQFGFIVPEVKLPIQISITATGYQPGTLSCSQSDTLMLIYLKPALTQLEEVVVTGVGGTAKIRSVPVAISVISAKELALHPNSNAIDALSRSVPGLQTVTTGPNVSKPSIRGLGYNRVLTLFDGIRQEGQQWADEHGIEADQYNIARAEVIKGPASIAYGSDAMAGVINILPFVPTQLTNKVKGAALLEYFSNNGMAATSVGLHQFKNAFFWTARASIKQAKDYQNKVDRRVFNTGFQEWNMSSLAGIKKAWGQSYVAFTAYDNLQEIPDGSRDSATRKFSYQIAEGLLDDMNNRPIVSNSHLNSYKIDPLHQHIHHYRLYNKTEIKLGSGQLQSVASFTKNIRQEYNHPTLPQQAGLYIVLNTFQYALSWNIALGKGYQFTTGINAMYQTNRSKNGTDFPIPDYDMNDAGIFAMLNKEWKNLTLSGGIRYDRRTIRWKDFYIATNSATGFDYHITNSRDTAGANLAFSQYQKNFTGFTASFGATYTINQHWFVKANIARGYRSPNITESGANGLDPGAHIYYIGNRNFSPEFNWQQDAGVFYNGSGLEIGLELFNNQISNYIFLEKMLDAAGQPVEMVPGNTTYTYRQGSARLFGVDASLKYSPRFCNWLKLQSLISSVTGLNQDETLLKQFGEAARYMPLISPLRIVSSVRVDFKNVSAVLQKPFLRLEADVFAAQRKIYAVQNTETATPGYQLVNAALGFDICRKNGSALASVDLQAENIFNLSYQSHLNRLKYFENYSVSPNGRSGIYNMGRNISIKAVINF